MFAVDRSSIDNAVHLDVIMPSSTRYFLILLNIAILVLTLGGNTIVLYGSIAHKALRLDRITLILVQNVAIADITISLLFYLPAFVNLIGGRWSLGYGMCFINGWISLVPSVCEIITMTLLSLYRLALILGKVSRATRQNPQPWFVALGMTWTGLVILPFFFSLADLRPYYDPYTQSCNSADLSDGEQPVYKITLIASLNIFFNLIPMILITTCNLVIVWEIYKTSSKTPKKNSVPMRTVKAIPLICLTFVFSYFPHAIACLSNFGVSLSPWWRTLSFYFQSLNTVANPLIYMAVNLDFRRYVVQLLTCRLGCEGGITSFSKETASTPSSKASAESKQVVSRGTGGMNKCESENLELAEESTLQEKRPESVFKDIQYIG